jgi:hypothetical protein
LDALASALRAGAVGFASTKGACWSRSRKVGDGAGVTGVVTTGAGSPTGSDAGRAVSPATPPRPMQTTAAVEAAMPATFAPEPMPRNDLRAPAREAKSIAKAPARRLLVSVWCSRRSARDRLARKMSVSTAEPVRPSCSAISR